MAERLVVIGGDAGGMAAASQARRQQPYMEIVAIERGRWTSYSACGIPYLVAGDVGSHQELVVRTPEEFDEGHLEGARNIDVSAEDFESRIEELDRSASYVVYCRTGSRAAAAVRTMLDAGFEDVVNGGGYEDLAAELRS